MSRLQLALNVDDIDTAVEFYSTLFDTAPAKRRPGYANFAVANPPLKLVLFENPGATGTLNHVGVERESMEEVEAEANRLEAAGPHPRRRGRRRLLLRPTGQALGHRPGRTALGELRRPRRRPPRARRQGPLRSHHHRSQRRECDRRLLCQRDQPSDPEVEVPHSVGATSTACCN